jgi:adenosylcobinamide-GDP ribazoletransferase
MGALQFLTVIPVRSSASSAGEAAVFFPIVGAMLGTSTGLLMMVLRAGLGRSVSALVALAWLMAVTGCLHEDGLADVADAVRAGRSREKMLEILKDSRIGTYGAIALILSVALRSQALAQSSVNPVAALASALALSRTSLVWLAAIASPVGTGLGLEFSAACSRTVVMATAAQAAVIVGVTIVFTGWRYGAAVIVASVTIVLLARFYFTQRLGGVNGDCLGAACQAVEIVNVVIMAWQPSI